MSRHRAPILKKIVTRPRYILVLLLSLVLVSYHLRTAQLLRQRRIMISELQRSVYSSTEERRPTCDWTEWHVSRYASLKSNFASSSPIFLAINLYNNEQVLPTFYQELPILLEHLGPQQVYVSIYENGSSDMTPELLHKLGDLLTLLQPPHKIVSLGQSLIFEKEPGGRINGLTQARNAALEPLYSGEAAKHIPGGKFMEMLFMNDIYFCAMDILEVIYQKQMQGANQACAMDWGVGQVIYDRWVLRTTGGRTFYNYEALVEWFNGPLPLEGDIPQLLPHDPTDRSRMESLLPLQVFSCWNGATIFDAKAFLPPHNIRFRQARNDLDGNGEEKNVTDKASECFLTSVDLWKEGMGKILIVPKASVAYGINDYESYRKDGQPPSNYDETKEKIVWETKPPEMVAFQDHGAWDIPERWSTWDEI